jgi:hypothetical protein
MAKPAGPMKMAKAQELRAVAAKPGRTARKKSGATAPRSGAAGVRPRKTPAKKK